MAIYDINGNLIADEPELADYYAEEMEDTMNKVKALQTEPNLTFFIITDIHAYYASNAGELYKTSINNMRYLLRDIPCNGVINLGDTLEGYSAKTTAQNYGNLITKEFRKISLPYYMVIGNHDDNRYHNSTSNDRLTVPERYQCLVSSTKKVFSDATGLNYYVDFEDFKIRMIVLNSVSDYTYSFDANTQSWFTEITQNIPAGYKALLCTHISPVGAWNYQQRTPGGASSIVTALNQIDLMAIICGHNHADAVFDSPFRGITLCCEKFENDSVDPSTRPSGSVQPQRTLETASEDCWSVCVIRPNSQKINFVRFGAGSDYEIDYGGET